MLKLFFHNYIKEINYIKRKYKILPFIYFLNFLRIFSLLHNFGTVLLLYYIIYILIFQNLPLSCRIYFCKLFTPRLSDGHYLQRETNEIRVRPAFIFVLDIAQNWPKTMLPWRYFTRLLNSVTCNKLLIHFAVRSTS